MMNSLFIEKIYIDDVKIEIRPLYEKKSPHPGCNGGKLI